MRNSKSSRRATDPHTGGESVPGPGTGMAVAREAGELGFSLDPARAGRLADYLALLEKWNAKMNLTGPGDWRRVLRELVVDSFYLVEFIDRLALREEPLCLDLGAGAGLPGIPLRVLWDKGEYVLVETREKREIFMRTALAGLELKGTRVVRERAEDVLSRMSPDMVVARAFMPWPELLDMLAGHLRAEAVCVVMSNEPPPETIKSWRFAGTMEYPAAGGKRYLWGLSPMSIPS